MKPKAPLISQKGNNIEIVLDNPFTELSYGWKIKVYKYQSILIPKEIETEAEAQETDADISLNTDKNSTDRYFPAIPKIEKDDFKKSARLLLTLEPSSKNTYTKKEIYYSDPDAKQIPGRFPRAYYYAVEYEDEDGLYEGLSDVEGIIPLPIRGQPQFELVQVNEKSIQFKISRTRDEDTDYFSNLYTGFNIIRSDCSSTEMTPLIAKGISIVPQQWKANSLIKAQIHSEEPYILLNYISLYQLFNMPLFLPVKSISLTFAGSKNQGLSQQILSKDEVEQLQGAALKLKISIRTPLSEKTEAFCMLDDGRSGKPESFDMELTNEWKIFEFSKSLNKASRKLDIIIAPKKEEFASVIEISWVSLVIDSLPAKEEIDLKTKEEVRDISAGTNNNKKPPRNNLKNPDTIKKGIVNGNGAREEVKDQKTEKQKRLFSKGEELLKNGAFQDYSKLDFVDSSFKFGKEYCYWAISLLEYQDNEYQGTSGEPLRLKPEDIFPPKPPVGLYTLARLDSVTLIWNQNQEADLAGYNIYRKNEKSGAIERLNNKPVKATQYIDTPPVVGEKYIYWVTAVDNSPRINESTPSNEVFFISRKDLKPVEENREKKK